MIYPCFLPNPETEYSVKAQFFSPLNPSCPNPIIINQLSNTQINGTHKICCTRSQARKKHAWNLMFPSHYLEVNEHCSADFVQNEPV